MKTPKGTELPILKLRGKDYLEVKYRLVWFCEERPGWSIETEFINHTENEAFVRATIRDESGRIVRTSHKKENKRGFPDFAEKAETGAIGRALALIGYGTQFCADELDEGDRIVDAPVAGRRIISEQHREMKEAMEKRGVGGGNLSVAPDEPLFPEPPPWPDEEPPGGDAGVAGEYVINVGKKYRGKRLKEVSKKELASYCQWLKEQTDHSATTRTFLSEAAKWLADNGVESGV